MILFCLSACGRQTQAVPDVSIETQTVLPSPQPTDTAIVPEITPTPASTATPTIEPTQDWLPIFDQFIADVKNDVPGQIVGVWVEKVLALRVVYQPPSDPAFVSTVDEVVTYFLYPWEKAGNHGLLAHNYLAGRYFFNLEIGDIIQLVFGDGDYSEFEINEIKEFQALQPDNPYSNFIDLVTGEQLTVNNVFFEVYMGDFHTTLQTCIANGNETEWGRQFVLAPPLY